MVSFAESDELNMIRKSLDTFLEQEVEPLAEEHRDLFTPDYRRLDEDGFLKPEAQDVIDTIRRKSGEAGFYGLHMPESVDGGGLSMVGVAQTIEHLYSRGFGLNIYTIENAPGPHPTLLQLDDTLKEQYLEPVIRGEKSACFALSEGSSASDALNMETRAEKDGDEWVINGRKMWITNSPYADFGQVFAVTDPEVDGPERISAFLFDTDNPGFSVLGANDTILNDGMQAEIEFSDMRVPEDHMVGERGQGFYGAMSTINEGRVRIAARCAGLMEHLLELSVDYANDRTSWGKPIGTRQHVRGMVAEIATWQEVVENLTLKTAWLVDNGENPIREGSIAKYYATEMLFKAADNAVQLFGANGLSHDYPVERILRYARLMRIPEGTSQIQLERIAEEVGLPPMEQ